MKKEDIIISDESTIDVINQEFNDVTTEEVTIEIDEKIKLNTSDESDGFEPLDGIQVGEYYYDLINVPNYDGFRIYDFYLVDDENIVIVYDNMMDNSNEKINKIILYNINDGGEVTIYDGKYISTGDLHFQMTEDGKLIIGGYQTSIVIDSFSPMKVEIYNFDDKSQFYRLSPDLTKVAYINEKGLFIEDFESELVSDVYINILEEENRSIAVEPSWSYDSKVFCYAIAGKKVAFKYCFIDENMSSLYDYTFSASSYGYWFEDKNVFCSTSLGENFGNIPEILMIYPQEGISRSTSSSDELFFRCMPKDKKIVIHKLVYDESTSSDLPYYYVISEFNIENLTESLSSSKIRGIDKVCEMTDGRLIFLGVLDNQYNRGLIMISENN